MEKGRETKWKVLKLPYVCSVFFQMGRVSAIVIWTMFLIVYFPASH